jgi:Na+/proline symporter
MVITFSVLAGFFAVIVGVLQVSKKREQHASFSNYAVGDRSFSSWCVTMAYLNSWFPGAVFMAYLAPAVTAGVIDYFFVVYTIIGVLAMYFIARPVWRWGKRFDLRTQSDLLSLRYNSRAVKVTASVVSTIALFPWLVLGLQSMGAIVQWASLNELSLRSSILIGVSVIAIRQIWTVQMGMRGLIITDMVQGLVAYVGSSVLCIGLIVFYFHGTGAMKKLPDASFSLPGFGSPAGGLYYFGLVAAGIVGSLCWPFIFTRIYTARSVRAVKKGVVQTMTLGLVFSGLLVVVGILMGTDKSLVAIPGLAWFALSQNAGGTWLLAAACLIVFAATMGMVDGVIQVMGTQVANDIVGVARPLRDKQEILVAKGSMVVFVILGLIVAYQTYNWANLINLGLFAYQAIVQLAVPLFVGMFWKRGSKVAAMAGLLVGSGVAVGLTIPYFSAAGAIPWLQGLGSGSVALAANAIVYLVCSYAFPNSAADQLQIDELFTEARARVSPQRPALDDLHTGSPAPAMK